MSIFSAFPNDTKLHDPIVRCTARKSVVSALMTFSFPWIVFFSENEFEWVKNPRETPSHKRFGVHCITYCINVFSPAPLSPSKQVNVLHETKRTIKTHLKPFIASRKCHNILRRVFFLLLGKLSHRQVTTSIWHKAQQFCLCRHPRAFTSKWIFLLCLPKKCFSFFVFAVLAIAEWVHEPLSLRRIHSSLSPGT